MVVPAALGSLVFCPSKVHSVRLRTSLLLWILIHGTPSPTWCLLRPHAVSDFHTAVMVLVMITRRMMLKPPRTTTLSCSNSLPASLNSALMIYILPPNRMVVTTCRPWQRRLLITTPPAKIPFWTSKALQSATLPRLSTVPSPLVSRLTGITSWSPSHCGTNTRPPVLRSSNQT